MSMKEIGGGRVYKAWNQWEIEEFVKGIYQEQDEDKFGKPTYVLEVQETNVEEFVVGDIVGLNSNGSLNKKMEKVIEGAQIYVEYMGMEVATGGAFKGKDCHVVKLLADNAYGKEFESDAEGDFSDDLDDAL